MKTRYLTLALAALVAVLESPQTARAQFDPLHNHLKCYRIKGQRVQKLVALDNQFGRELVVKMVPELLCLPTQKTCCLPGVAGCQPIPCGSDPVAAAPVHHFKCYKITAKTCGTPGCTDLTGFKRGIKVTLRDQFGVETLDVGRPQLLCTPTEKQVVSSTTTTTSTSTTTTILQPCHGPNAAGMCAGACPPAQTCLATSPTSCDCVPTDAMCMGGAGNCNGLCPDVRQRCLAPSTTAPCDCFEPCDLSPFPTCGGVCPPQEVCRPITAAGDCRCMPG